ncbi:MAG: hypothetical protein FJX20_11160 [Alphaproteobacteria bacterium]|nr:hypothetical protein [Alphaproteobacteria bacterium]
MTIFTVADLRDHPAESIVERVSGTLALWRKRARERTELTKITARDARDLGLDPGILAIEASKPFWRA